MIRRISLAIVTMAAFLAMGTSASGHAPFGDAMVSNGTVLLGIHQYGHLNVPGGPPSSGTGTTEVGLRFVPTGAEATAPGCLCEGWGAADAVSGVTGYANESIDGVVNLTPISFTTTASTAVSVVEIGTTLRVTHDYHPSIPTPNLYEVDVTIENISGASVTPRYRRVMDWDVEPTAFSEFVTAEDGSPTAAELITNNNDGFTTANPLGPTTSGAVSPVVTGDFTDAGPDDHGALFDFGFDPLAPGETKEFTTFYGAAADETSAFAALATVGAGVFSLGQPSSPGGPDLGVPNTFIFAFGGVGENTLTLEPATAENPVGTSHTVTATLKDGDGNPVSGATILFNVTGANTASGSGTTDSNGQTTFTYTGTNTGGDTITACHDNNTNGSCDPGEATGTATKVWTEAPKVIEGRMTGGGSVFTSDGKRVTHGFALHCDATDPPNNLQVNWGKGNKFHLETLTSATCTDDPGIDPAPPAAPFDTYEGTGSGRYNGRPATATWKFTDAGEPGTNDVAEIEITETASSSVVLSVAGKLKNGNHQAHAE